MDTLIKPGSKCLSSHLEFFVTSVRWGRPAMEVYLVTRPQALKQAHIKCFFVILEQVLFEIISI